MEHAKPQDLIINPGRQKHAQISAKQAVVTRIPTKSMTREGKPERKERLISTWESTVLK